MHRSSGPAGTFPTTGSVGIASTTSVSVEPTELTRVSTDVPPLQFDETDPTHNASAFSDCVNSGSLFSVHSAPPVPLNDLANTAQNSCSLGFEIGNDSPRRPISLAIDAQYHSSKTIATFQHQGSEVEEEDNENLLTVSSLTARPLIAKSRELRTTK